MPLSISLLSLHENEKSMRFAFLDEAGISKHEPVVVVAGIIVDGDKDLIRVEAEIGSLIERYIPDIDRQKFVLHATNVFSGTRYFSDRNVWPPSRRAALLYDLIGIIEANRFPVVAGYISRAET